MKTAWLLLLLLGVGALGGCAVNPATGKSDFVMMSEQQELGMGARYNQEILKQFPRYNDEKLQAYVQRVGERVARSSHRSNLQYHFTVIDSPDINAFALPGGYIYIHRGLIAYLGSEAELAAVLGHEVGHVTARHSVRQQSQARAGYDPTAMIQVVRVLKNQEDFAREEAARNGQAVQAGGYHGLFDTHPDNDRRLQEVVGPARQLANGQQEVGREVFLRHLEGMPFGDSASAGVRRGQNFYHAELDFTLSYPAGWKILNQPSALLGYPADEQSFIGMKLVPHDSRLTPAEFLRKNAGQRLAQEESLKQAGLNGYTAVVPGNPARRVAVIYQGDRAYLFVGVVKVGSLETQDDRFLSVIRSFRPLRDKERALAQPRRLHLVQVKAGQTLEQLAAGGEGSLSDSVARLRLLNDLYPSGEPRPGDWLKVVR
ncbi:MAG: M48 family metalloprotease [Pseudomonas aeruginosa]|nr:M48 family metalloprotease [Pseudomonas aeruginosa]